MLSNFSQNVKFLLLAAGIVLIGAVGYGVYTFIDRGNKVAVTVNALPEDAFITLNGEKTATGTVHLKEGSYTVKGTKDGFADFSSQIYIDKEHALISVPLVPTSDAAKKWQRDNMNKYTLLESAAGRAASEEGEAFKDKNPITITLPYKNLIYTIGYRADPSDPSGNSIILEIDAPEGYRNAAVQQIRNMGYDPTNYKINFKDYKNPFSS